MVGYFILYDVENDIGVRVGNSNGANKLNVLNSKLKKETK